MKFYFGKHVFGVLALLPLAAPAMADELDQLGQLTLQAEFRELSEDLGSVLSYKALVPAETLGISGFDVGASVTVTKIENSAVWDRVSSSDSSSTVVVPKIFVHKGLPFGIDIGAFYSSVPDSDISLWGAEVRYALIEGGTATPALGLRASYSELSGIDQLEFDTKGLELTISKGFANFTPYAGIGRVWVTSTPVGVPQLSKERFALNKYYLGGNFNLGILNIAVEGDRTGEATSYGVKFGWRF